METGTKAAALEPYVETIYHGERAVQSARKHNLNKNFDCLHNLNQLGLYTKYNRNHNLDCRDHNAYFRVEALQAASPLLRYTSLLPPVPHPLATSHGEAATPLPSQATKITSQVRLSCSLCVSSPKAKLPLFFRQSWYARPVCCQHVQRPGFACVCGTPSS